MNALALRSGRLLRRTAARPGCEEWDVEVDGETRRALVLPEIQPGLAAGERVLLNATALALSLGTGGAHFVLGRLHDDEAWRDTEFPGREAGHILKLRYTPLQFRVLAAEEEASPHHAAVRAFSGLDGRPVLAAELHSQACAAILAARAAAPGIRIVLLQLDTAALPFGISRLAARLRTEGRLDAVVTVGQGFGGDFEAVNVHSGLVVAVQAAGADLIVATQGPGNVGTGTEYGFSGLALAEALHAAHALGGQPLLAPRISQADARARHLGLSHHTATLLRCTLCPVTIPLPVDAAPDDSALDGRDCPRVNPTPFLPALTEYAGMLTTMGRNLEQDHAFFAAAAAAGICAARWAASRTVGAPLENPT